MSCRRPAKLVGPYRPAIVLRAYSWPPLSARCNSQRKESRVDSMGSHTMASSHQTILAPFCTKRISKSASSPVVNPYAGSNGTGSSRKSLAA